MQLPNRIPPFTTPTILLVCDHVRTVGYRASERSVEKIFDVSVPLERASDRPGVFMTRGRGGRTLRSGAPEDPARNKLMRERHHLEHLVFEIERQLTPLVGREAKLCIVLFAPLDCRRALVSKMKKTLRERIFRVVPGIFTKKLNPVQLVERLYS